MKASTAAISFVVAVRVLWFAVGVAITFPLKFIAGRLPQTDGIHFERLEKLREWIVANASRRLPDWVEHHGSGILMVHTTRGMDHLDAAVDQIPKSIIDRWCQFGILVIGAFLVAWGALLLGLLAATFWAGGIAVTELVEFAAAYDWAALSEPQPLPRFDPIAQLQEALLGIVYFAVAAAVLLVVFLISIVVWWLLMIPILPGLVLHEFGHYAAIRQAGATVENYGLLLLGPYLGGAFVEPADDAEELGAYDTFAVWSGGIANTVIWGVLLIAGGLSIGGDPLTLLNAIWESGFVVAAERPVASTLILVGMLELLNGFLNAVPVGPVDGGGFIRSFEEEWWGIETPRDVLTRGDRQ